MPSLPPSIAIIGGGPAGLMAAEILSARGLPVTIYDRKPSVGRKFLMAGRGGLNLTHSEEFETFMTRYGAQSSRLRPWIEQFTPADLRQWCEGLGQPTFVGSSGRVFPESFKASPLLRAWLGRLETSGVRFVSQRKWEGWDNDNHLLFSAPDGTVETIKADITLLALGGASWPGLGSDGSWAGLLAKEGVSITPLQPANCGFAVNWSDIFRDKFAGTPLKAISVSHQGQTVTGEVMIARNGLEGGAVYALSSSIREEILRTGTATITIDLRPTLTQEKIHEKLNVPRGRQSFSTYLQKTMNLSPLAINLLREADKQVPDMKVDSLSSLIKSVPVLLTAPFPIDRAISTAGGVALDSLTPTLMLKNKPGVFIAGEMLDWEAPTGGYLLQATLATGQAAARGIMEYLSKT